MLGTSGPMQRPARASFLPFGIQWFHRAEATAVFVGQVARVLRIADDHRRQQDDHLAAAGTRGLLAEQSADDGNPAQAREAAGTAPHFVLDQAGEHHRVAAAHSGLGLRSEEHTSELQSLMRISYAVFCLKKKTTK